MKTIKTTLKHRILPCFDVELTRTDRGVNILIPFNVSYRKEEFAELHTEYEPEKKKGYCQRTRELLQDMREEFERLSQKSVTWDKYTIIDYPLEETVAIKCNRRRPDTFIACVISVLEKHKAEIRLIKPVKNGTIMAVHFND